MADDTGLLQTGCCTDQKLWKGYEEQERERKRFEAACLAMQGLLANPNTTARPEMVAVTAVDYADALLEELEARKA